MKKLFTLAVAVLASMAMFAETVTMDLALAKGSTPSPSIGAAVMSGGAFDGSGYKLGSDGNYIGWNIAAAEKTFSAVTFNGYINTGTVTGKNWGFQFSTDGGTTWGSELLQANDGTKSYHDIAVTVEIPEGANALRIIRRAGTSAYVKSITLTLADNTPVTDSVKTVTVEGPTAGIIGQAVAYTATTDVKATNYKWYLNGAAINGETNKKLEYTPMAAGKYIFSCRAWNENNLGEGIMSNYLTLNVTDPAEATGEIIKAELTSGTAATVTGVIGGTADVSLSSNKKMDKNKYFGITLAAGNFKEGDTVVITMTTAGSNYPCLFADKERTNCLFLATEVSTDLEYRIVLPAAANSINTLYVSRGDESDGYKWNPVLSSMAVVRPMAAKNVVESLTGVAVNDVAISDLAALLANHEITLADSYVNAPVVKFTKHVVTTYTDDSQAEKDVVVEVTAEEVGGAWEAAATIGGVAYTVKAAKENSVVVTYMDGETQLGEENVAIGGHPADFAQYQNKSLASFVGWYNNADLADEHIVADMSSEVISVATTYYAKFENAYAQSINIEKAVMQNGKGYAIIPQLGTLKYASNITGSLDSLAVKDDGLRNYAYLGLKVKQAGALLNFRLAKGSTVKVKFGNVAKTPSVSINGGEYAEMTITDKVYSYTAEEEAIVSIKTADGSAVVFQQIMINEDIQAPELFTITCAAAEHGTVSAAYKMGIPGEVIKLSFTMDEGYTVASCYANDVEVVGTAEGEFFTMPAANVTITATFGDETTAIDNTNAELKAVKVIENGQIFIIKNGVKYNAQGAVVR